MIPSAEAPSTSPVVAPSPPLADAHSILKRSLSDCSEEKESDSDHEIPDNRQTKRFKKSLSKSFAKEIQAQTGMFKHSTYSQE